MCSCLTLISCMTHGRTSTKSPGQRQLVVLLWIATSNCFEPRRRSYASMLRYPVWPHICMMKLAGQERGNLSGKSCPCPSDPSASQGEEPLYWTPHDSVEHYHLIERVYWWCSVWHLSQGNNNTTANLKFSCICIGSCCSHCRGSYCGD